MLKKPLYYIVLNDFPSLFFFLQKTILFVHSGKRNRSKIIFCLISSQMWDRIFIIQAKIDFLKWYLSVNSSEIYGKFRVFGPKKIKKINFSLYVTKSVKNVNFVKTLTMGHYLKFSSIFFVQGYLLGPWERTVGTFHTKGWKKFFSAHIFNFCG